MQSRVSSAPTNTQKTKSHRFSLLLRRPLLLHGFLPLVTPDRSCPSSQRRDYEEKRGNCREPADADLLNNWKTSRRASSGEEISDNVVSGHDFRRLLFHHVLIKMSAREPIIARNRKGDSGRTYQTISIQTRETEQLRHALHIHHNHR